MPDAWILFFLTHSIITSLKSSDVKQRSARRCSKFPLSLDPCVLVERFADSIVILRTVFK